MNKITVMSESSDAYPKLLKEIQNRPSTLYCRGNIDLLSQPCLAVVGTRKITDYGYDATQKLVSELAQHFCIVSGLALGIDAVAHRTCLENGGRTIAVLSAGVTDASVGPKTNFGLAMDILSSGGLLVSEYEHKGEISRYDFPRRNRIISGISQGVLIIEADFKSGSMTTAMHAVDQNRDLFTIPGSIFSDRTQGPHFLIQKGAKLVSSSRDILDELNLLKI